MACFFIAFSYDTKPAAKYFFALAEELAAQGHQIIVITPEQKDKITVKNQNIQLFTWLSKRPTHFKDALFLHRLIKKFRPDCIISTFASVNICTLVGWLNKVPNRIVWYRTMSRALEIDVQMPDWKIYFYRLRKRLIYRLATKLIANSKAAAQDLQKVYAINEEKSSVLHFLVEDPKIDSPPRTDEIICVGRLHPCKGQETLIRAVAELKSSFPQIAVNFVGGGRERENYENLAKKLGVERHCRFSGAASSDEVFRQMAQAALCVVPSRDEAFGWVNVEAHSVGTPVVASAVGGIKEVVVDGQTGFLVAPDDVAALTEKIELLLKNTKLRKKFGKQSLVHFEENFSMRHLNRHTEFFENLIAD